MPPMFSKNQITMKTRIIPSLLTCFLFAGIATSDPVDEGQIIDFQAGTPARAADMNQTMQELISAINDNAAEVKALREQLSIVASKVNLPQPTLEQNLAGSVYRVNSLEAGHGTSSVRTGLTEIGRLRDSVFAESGTLTLNANNTLSYAFAGSANEAEVFVNSGFSAEDPNSQFPVIMDVNVSQADFPENDTLPGTWALAGNVLTLTLDGEDETVAVSVDGNTLLLGGTDSFVDGGLNMFEASMAVAVRVSKPQPNIEVRVEIRSTAAPYPWILESNPENNGAAELINQNNGQYRIVISNTGTGDLVLGSSIMIQDTGGDFSFPNQNAPITIAPGTEYTGLVLTNPVSSGSNRRDAAIYLMSNDPDTPTFIYNIYSDQEP
jgi:hypothetical protein